MARILHTGDIHLDSAFAALSPELARERRAGLRCAVSKIADTAIAERVDAVILPGDLFDAYPVYPETAESLLRDLARIKVPVFISPGNHDPYTADSPYHTLAFPENVYIFTSESLSFKELPELSLRVFGAAFTSPVKDESILSGFSVPDDDYINIISLHANLYSYDYCPITEEDIARSGADYVALAHVHKPTDILRAGNTYYAYCGCPEARAFDEQYDTGIIVGDVEKGSVNLSRRRVSDFRYRELTVDISKTPDVISALPQPTGRELLRLFLVGEGEAPDVDALYDAIKPRYYELTIRDRTTAPRDIWLGIEEDSLRGIFLRRMRKRLDASADTREREMILLAARLGIDAIENRDS